MSHVFLSHNSADKAQVVRLARAFERENVPIWLDAFDLNPDDRWEPLVYDAVDRAGLVLACIGEHGKGPWHDRELARAARAGKTIRVALLPGWRPELGLLGHDEAIATDLSDGDWTAKVFALVNGCRSLAEAEGGNGRFTAMVHEGPFGHNGSPYPGVDAAFEAHHAAWFFGREAATASVLEAFDRHRWVWLVGNSGSGKSSLARAGVMAWWPRAGKEPGASSLLRASAGPSSRLEMTGARDEQRGIAVELVGALERLCRRAGAPLREDELDALVEDPRRWSRKLVALFGERAVRPRLLLVVDQAEQIFDPRAGLRAGYAEVLELLGELCAAESVQLRVLVVLRADWLPRALSEPVLQPIWSVSDTRVALSRMSELGLREAIEVPARRAGGGVERSVVDTLVRDATARPGGLPLLQIVLQGLWEARGHDGQIRWDNMPTDPIAHAIEHRVEEQGLPSDPTWIDTIVPLLVEIDDRGLLRRRELTEEEVATREDNLILEDQLAKLVAARLVIAEIGPPPDQRRQWQLAHEAVLTGWRACTEAIEQRLRPRLALRDECERLAEAWARGGRDAGALPRGSALAKLESLRQGPSLSRCACDYLEAATLANNEADARERESNERLRQTQTQMLVAVARLALPIDPLVSLLALCELEEKHLEPAKAALYPILAEEIPIARILAPASMQRASWHPDGNAILAVSDDATSRIWSAKTGVARSVMCLPSGIVRADWSPSGDQVLTISRDGRVQIWDQHGTSHFELPSASWRSPVTCASWHEFASVALGHSNGNLTLYDTVTGNIIEAPGADEALLSISWHPNGTAILGSSRHSAIIWKNTSTAPSIVRSSSSDIFEAAWAPDGEHFVVQDRSVFVHSFSHSARGLRLGIQRRNAMFYGSIARETWTAKTVVVRNDSLGNAREVLQDIIVMNSVAWRGDGKKILTSHDDGSLRVWDPILQEVAELAVQAHDAPLQTPRWNPDGIHVAAGSTDGTVQVWRLDEPYTRNLLEARPATLLKGHTAAISFVAWSPDGRHLFTLDRSGNARVWDLTLVLNGGASMRQRLNESTSISDVRARTSANLTPRERQQWLGEDEASALENFVLAEKRLGRNGHWPPA